MILLCHSNLVFIFTLINCTKNFWNPVIYYIRSLTQELIFCLGARSFNYLTGFIQAIVVDNGQR